MAARTTKPKPSPKALKPSGKARPKAKAKKAAAKPQPMAQAASKKAPPKAKEAAKAKLAGKPTAAAKAKPATNAKPGPPVEAKPTAKAKTSIKPGGAAAKKLKPHAAREALKELKMKKAIAQVIAPVGSGTAVVDAYMRDVDHPFKSEMEAVRRIILGASSKIVERIKWNAPSFHYKEDLGAFHPRATEYAHLILLFPAGAGIPAKSTLLEGKQKDRREAKFFSLADVEAKRSALEKLVRDWVALRDA